MIGVKALDPLKIMNALVSERLLFILFTDDVEDIFSVPCFLLLLALHSAFLLSLFVFFFGFCATQRAISSTLTYQQAQHITEQLTALLLIAPPDHHKELVTPLQMTETSNSSIAFFFAGALLPTVALLLQNKKKAIPSPPVDISIDGADFDDDDSSSDFDDDDSSAAPEIDGEISQSWGMRDAPYKMVLCVNTSLGMGKGKIAAQCCHAAVGCYKKGTKVCPAGVKAWELTGCAKIAVKCPSEDEMMNEILIKAINAGIPAYFVEDAGRTQIAAGSRTVLGLGPAPVHVFEGITSHLKLM